MYLNLTNYQTAAEEADIIAFLVAHDEFKNFDYKRRLNWF